MAHLSGRNNETSDNDGSRKLLLASRLILRSKFAAVALVQRMHGGEENCMFQLIDCMAITIEQLRLSLNILIESSSREP